MFPPRFLTLSEAILMTLGKQIFPMHTVKQTELLLAVLEPSVTQGALLVPPRAAVRCSGALQALGSEHLLALGELPVLFGPNHRRRWEMRYEGCMIRKMRGGRAAWGATRLRSVRCPSRTT